MLITKTIVLKLKNPNKELVATIDKYTEGMNYVSGIVFENKKTIPIGKLQKQTYNHLRKEIGLKSQMSCNIVRQVCGTYATLKKQIKEKKTKWQKIKYAPTNITYSYKRDFTITENTLGLTTLKSRNKYEIMNYKHAKQYFDGTWKYCASKLVKHKSKGLFFHLTVEKEITEKPITSTTEFIGVDVGMNHLAVATTTEKKNVFFRGGDIKNLRNTFSTQRKRLQKKGTRSAKRMLKHLRERETRLMKNVNHVVSKQIIETAMQYKVPLIAMENLTGIRERTTVKKKQRYGHSSWAFRELQSFVEYKAKEKGLQIIFVNPAYTSQTCSRCGHIEKSNRKGRNFVCKACAFELNADLNASRNIEHKARNFRHDLEFQGCVSATQTKPRRSEFQAPPIRVG